MFFFTSVKFRTACADILANLARSSGVSAPRQQFVEFVEDYKELFDGLHKKGKEPDAAIFLAVSTILASIDDGTQSDIRSYDNCRIEYGILLMVAPLCIEIFKDNQNHEAANHLTSIVSRFSNQIEEVVSAAESMMSEKQLQKWKGDNQDKEIKKDKSDLEVQGKPKIELPKPIKERESEKNEELVTTSTTSIICSPQRAYFNREFKIHFCKEVGAIISKGEPILRMFDQNETIEIKAVATSKVTKMLVSDGTSIRASNVELCEVRRLAAEPEDGENITETSTNPNDVNLKSLETSNPKFGMQLELSVEQKLERLKKLYEKKLISRSVYQDKQRQIMEDF